MKLNRVVSTGMFAVAAAAMIGAGYVDAGAPATGLLAECFDGQVVDSSTGTCPDANPSNPADTSADTSGDSAAVKGAEAATQADESLAGMR